MAAGSQPGLGPLRFGVFELDPKAGELRKNGRKLRIEGQPLQILALLLEKPGEIVYREELKRRLWSQETFVDFEHGINTGIRRLRDALDDSAETPRFIETVPRRGYRFIYPVNGGAASHTTSVSGHSPPLTRSTNKRLVALTVAAIALAMGLVVSVPAVRDRLLGRMSGKTLSVAVLPLRNLSGDPQQDYFADGMTEMLITELGSHSSLQVLSHQSVFSYAGSTKKLPEIADDLGVDAVIEGTVQRLGSRVRVTVNFVQARPEGHLLAKSFEKELPDVFQVQEEIARAIADALHVPPPQAASSAPTHPVPGEATDAYLRGTSLLARGRETDREQARADFLKAIEIDPSFARPYAALAVMYSHGGAARGGTPGSGLQVTHAWAIKALQLDGSLSDAHAALGWVSLSEWDFKKAEQEFQRAIELNPSNRWRTRGTPSSWA